MQEARIQQLERRLESLEALVLEFLARGAPAPEAPVAAVGPAAEVSRRNVVVRVGERLLGVPLERIEEVVRMVALAPVPGSHPALEGVLDLRGRPVEVVDVRVALGLARLDDDIDARIVIVRAGGRAFGLKVDEVLELLTIDPATAAPPPVQAAGRWLVGVSRSGERLVLLLDLDGVVEVVASGAQLEDPGLEASTSTERDGVTESEGPNP